MDFVKCPCGNDYKHINRDEHFMSVRHIEYIIFIDFSELYN